MLLIKTKDIKQSLDENKDSSWKMRTFSYLLKQSNDTIFLFFFSVKYRGRKTLSLVQLRLLHSELLGIAIQFGPRI